MNSNEIKPNWMNLRINLNQIEVNGIKMNRIRSNYVELKSD